MELPLKSCFFLQMDTIFLQKFARTTTNQAVQVRCGRLLKTKIHTVGFHAIMSYSPDCLHVVSISDTGNLELFPVVNQIKEMRTVDLLSQVESQNGINGFN